jgi:hypothetical protein
MIAVRIAASRRIPLPLPFGGLFHSRNALSPSTLGRVRSCSSTGFDGTESEKLIYRPLYGSHPTPSPSLSR